MIRFVVHQAAAGSDGLRRILRTGTVGDPAMVVAQAGAGEVAITVTEDLRDDLHAIDASGAAVLLPPAPPDPEAQHEEVRRLRRIAFIEEADPLFFKVARGEATQAEYDALIAEIRARYPYPEEEA